MIFVERCPICLGRDLKLLTRRVSLKVDPPVTHGDVEVNFILDVIHKQPQMELSFFFCRDCYHVFSSPTFSPAEIDLLYSPHFFEYSQQISGDGALKELGQKQNYSSSLNRVENILIAQARLYRPNFISEVVKRKIRTAPKLVLDFGGRDGNIITMPALRNALAD